MNSGARSATNACATGADDAETQAMRGVVLADDARRGMAMVCGQPVIHYAIATLLSARIAPLLVVAPAAALAHWQDLLGDGARWGIGISYCALPASVAPAQRALAAVRIAGEFVGGRSMALIAADEILHGAAVAAQAAEGATLKKGALLLCRRADSGNDDDDGEHICFDANGKATKLARGESSAAIATALRFYDGTAAARARALPDHAALADLHQSYLDAGALRVAMLHPPSASLRIADDVALARTEASLRADATPYRVDEIAWRAGWIDDDQLRALADTANDDCARHLRALLISETTGVGG